MTMAQFGLLAEAGTPKPERAPEGSLVELTALSQMRVG